MEIFTNYHEIPSTFPPIVLTIGNFDAVHQGHRRILKEARKVADKIQGKLLVFTFSNHPIEVLRPEKTLQKICTLKHKLELIKEEKVDGVLILEFSLPFSKQTAKEFLQSLKRHFSFEALILGYDARIGHDRQGDSPHMHHLAQKLHFKLQYVPAHMSDGQPISSSAIRKAVFAGNLAAASQLLGRSYSIFAYTTPKSDQVIEVQNLEGMCLPPEGVYDVQIRTCGNIQCGTAYIQNVDIKPSIEVHFAEPKSVQGLTEIVFSRFIKNS